LPELIGRLVLELVFKAPLHAKMLKAQKKLQADTIKAEADGVVTSDELRQLREDHKVVEALKLSLEERETDVNRELAFQRTHSLEDAATIQALQRELAYHHIRQ
jgi:hypothetical protein